MTLSLTNIFALHGIVKMAYYYNVVGYVEYDAKADRYAVHLPVALDELKIPEAILQRATDDIMSWERDVYELLVGDADTRYMPYAMLGLYYGALTVRCCDGSRVYVLTFAPKGRVDTRVLARLLLSIRRYIETPKLLYGSAEDVVLWMLRDIYFSLTYHYHALDDVYAILWTIDCAGSDVKVNMYKTDTGFIKERLYL